MYEHNGDVLCPQLNGTLSNGVGLFGTKQSSVRELHSRDVEMLRLIGQYLCDKGLNGAYAQLSRESGVSLEHDDATELRHATLEGRWSDAHAAVDRLAPLIGDPESVDEVRFLLLEQRFLEHLEANEVMPAVTLLRNQITPMQRNTERVHTLASCLMCRTAAELSAQAGGWAGKDAGSRLQLINRIQAFVPAQTMLPPRRLEELIEESVRSQLSTCIFHNPPMGSAIDLESVSLLQRHSCGMYNFPAFCIQTLHQRDGELWLCQFSPDGCYLAVGGKDANVDVLRVDAKRHTLSRFRVLPTPCYIGCLCWSPDSKKLAACCGEEQSSVYVFDVVSGQQLCNQKVNDEDTYSTATFFADSRKLAFGGLKGLFYVMDTEDQGRILTSVEGYRVQSMAAILPPIPHIGLESTTLDGTKVNSVGDLAAPGGPDSAFGSDVPLVSGLPALTGTSNGQIDQLLVADSLHRIRLFRFGALGPLSTNGNTTTLPGLAVLSTTEAGDTITPSAEIPVSTSSSLPVSATVLSTVEDEPNTSSSNLTDLAVYFTASGAPGAPGTTSVATSTNTMSVSVPSSVSAMTSTAAGIDNPSVAAALTVARLSRQQQQRLLQSSNVTTGTTSSSHLFWNQPSHLAHGVVSNQGVSVPYSSSPSPVPPGILFDMPILPVSLTRVGPSPAQSAQQQTHPHLRPVLHHSGSTLGGTPYTVVSSSSGASLGPGGSSLTILFGPSLERSSSAATYTSSGTSSTTTSSSEVRALTAAAAAAALAGSHSRSFAGLVHSLSSMVAASSAPVDASSARTLSTATEVGINPMVCTTSTSTSTISPVSTVANLSHSGGRAVSSVTSSTGFTPSTTTAQVAGGCNYGLLDHRTLFKETHAVQSITMSRSGQRALITIHKMVSPCF
ncbi:WD repeat-containing protein 26 [Paragonimus skrjabini miyazakii]|uniref:WD repeat-containing protein 26 n=1 Tax=Paragonimus skrjabini miyazakii TaxID=59628 RepID=A0A8S9Y8U3_9TREM|nr:WD repeat-containing protein 26 [Paragonimus skrjabini miyazakii]